MSADFLNFGATAIKLAATVAITKETVKLLNETKKHYAKKGRGLKL